MVVSAMGERRRWWRALLLPVLMLPALVLPVASVAAGTHNDLFSGRWFHAPVADDDCTVCHTIHRNPVAASLQAPMPELCHQCHENMAAKDVVHEPVGEGRCTDCHVVHTSEHRPLLLRRVPDLCIGCHPVDDSHVGRGTLCTGCHGVHSSETSRFLKGERTRNCRECHKDKHTGVSRHAPAREGKCLTCHYTHPDPRFSQRLRTAYPEEAYATYREDLYALCDRCHPPALHADPSDRQTGFRTANMNLHNRHVAGERGVTCSLCHDLHSAGRPALMLEWVRVPEQGQQLLQFLRFSTGGSCGPSCHAAATYLREEEAEMVEEEW